MPHEVLNVSHYHKTIPNFVLNISTLGNNNFKKIRAIMFCGKADILGRQDDEISTFNID